MNNLIKTVTIGQNKKTINETRTKLNLAYDLVNEYMRDTNYFITNATDIINDSIRITIVGNINEELDTNKLKQFATVTKTVTKKNKKYITLKILKKTISPKNEEKKTIRHDVYPDKTEKISIFKHRYNDGHEHSFNKDGYCLLCGVNKNQLKKVTIELNIDAPIEKVLDKIYQAYGFKDEYLRYQLSAISFEINKGVNDGFKWFPDETYLNEKIRKVLNRIEEIRHDNRVKALREQRRID